MSFLHTLANPLSQTQKQNVAKKFRDILDDMTSPLLAAIQYAHTYGIPSVKREEIWKNLFIPPNKELLDPKRNSPSKPPANIYQDWDIQVVLKYLYYGGQRITSFSPVKLYAQDQECYFNFFNITHRYLSLKPPADDPVGLFAGDYSRALFQAISLRNNTYHNTQNNVEEFTVAGCAAFVEHLSVLLRPLCGAVSWDQTGMERAQKLVKQMWPDVCNAMGDVSYPIADILAYLRIPSTEQTIVEQMLIDAGFTVDQGDVYICGDVDELAYGLLYAWKVGQQIGKEYGVNLLHGCRERMLVFLTPDREEKVYEQKDWQSMPLEVLEKLAQEENAQAQYQLYCRFCDSEKQSAQILAWGYLQRSARLGYAPAQVQMGIHLEDGTCGQKRSWKEAFSWYEKAAGQNDADGMCRIGMCYENGVGVEADLQQAAVYYHLAKNRGSQAAKVYEAALQLSGAEEESVKAVALETLHTLAEEGFPLANAILGKCYFLGCGVEKSDCKAANYLIFAAKSGDKTGQYWLGMCWESNSPEYIFDQSDWEDWIDCDENWDINAPWKCYRKAALQGHVDAQLRYLDCCNIPEMTKWLTEIAQQTTGSTQLRAVRLIVEHKIDGWEHWGELMAEKDADMAFQLAKRYHGKDIRKTVKNFELAAKNDRKYAYLLIDLYETGEATGKSCGTIQLNEAINPQRALSWLENVGGTGDVQCCLRAAEYYLKGKAGSRNLDMAIYWYKQAARYGHNEAYLKIAEIFIAGKYAPKDRSTAIRYYLQGLQEAVKIDSGYKVMEKLDHYLQPGLPTEVCKAAWQQLEKLAQRKWGQAMIWLGHYCLIRRDLSPNPQEGILWLKRAYEECKELDAAFILASVYKDGILVPKDLKRSLYWLLRIAPDWEKVGIDAWKNELSPQYQYIEGGKHSNGELGLEIGEPGGGWYLVAQYYDNGWGIPEDQSKAFKCYDKAREQGCRWCLGELIRRYEQGIGVPPDPDMARRLRNGVRCTRADMERIEDKVLRRSIVEQRIAKRNQSK